MMSIMSDRGTPITSTDELEAIVGTPEPRVAAKTAVERQGDPLETLEEYYGPAYADRMYG